MRLASLRARVTSWYASLLAAALVVFGAAVYLGLQNYLQSSLEHALEDEAGNIGREFVAYFETKGLSWLAGEIRESYAPERTGQFIRIVRGDGTVLYQSGASPGSAIQALSVPGPDLAAQKPSFRTVMVEPHLRVLLYAEPYRSQSGARYFIQTGASTTGIDRILRSLLIALCLLTPGILVAAAVGGYLLMSVPLRPMVALTHHAERIGTKALGERLPVIPTGDELERLSLALNQMISRLEDALAHNRRFSADVSHELRTPLTILRGELEPLVQLPGLDSSIQEAIGSALEEIDRMSDTVESLLAISKLDSGGALIQKAAVDLGELAVSTVEQMQLLAEDKQLSIRALAAPGAVVLGDRVRLQQVIVNLLDNALKYTLPGGQVGVHVSIDGQSAALEVNDNGMGIPPASLPFVFDRFYRADKARSRESGGTGLGLSIVKAICAAHDGSVTIRSSEGEGTTVRVALPLLPLGAEPPASGRPPGAARATPQSEWAAITAEDPAPALKNP